MATNAGTAVILSPHLDDAVLSCWHVLDSPRDVRVLNVFSGVPPAGTRPPRWDRITGAADPADRVRLRLDEDRIALALAGREPTNLGLVESQYRTEKPTLDEVLPLVRERVAAAAEVIAPAGIGGHSAHLLLRDTALELAEGGCEVAFYADLPYATQLGWPHWVTGAERDPFLDVDADWLEALAPLLERGWEPRVVVLDEDVRRRKIEAMRAYHSQFAALEAGGQRRLTHPELVPYEVLWARRAV